jgi:hypothetical protein
LILLHSILYLMRTLVTSLQGRTRRATTWLPWLGVALVVAAVLAPGTVTASLLAFQSSPVATPVPPTPTQPPPPPPTPTQPQPPPTQPTATPVQPTPIPPAQAPAPTTEAPPPQATPIAPAQPTQPAAAPTMSPTPVVLPALTPTPLPPLPTPIPMPTPQPPSGANQPIVNWIKFWDTIAVTLAYPWLCCGVALLLMVPVGLLFLEIKGRRRPPSPPEQLMEEKDYKE